MVVLRIDSGCFSTGFQVVLRVLQDGRQIGNDRSFFLPAASHIPLLYGQWKQAYLALGRLRKVDPPVDNPSRGIVIPDQHTNIGSDNPIVAQKALADQLLVWFSLPEFVALEASVCRSVSRGNCDSIPIAIHSQTKNLDTDQLLRKLPWHLWSLFTKLDNSDAILMSDYAPPVSSFGKQIRVLIILGSDEGGLDLKQDLNAFKDLERRGAKVLGEADFATFRERDSSRKFDKYNCLILPVMQQDLDMTHALIYRNSWDIIFFAGHSFSDSSCQNGHLELRPGLCVPIEAFKTALQQSVKQGLKLVIFNSCDGLGLAESLIKFQVPNVIVMREPVPDRVAQKFLSYFLDEFLQGHPLCKAVLHSRNQLHALEYAAPPYPGASWLPILLKNPNQPDLIWPFPPSLSVDVHTKDAWRLLALKWLFPLAIGGGIIWLMLAILSDRKPSIPIVQPPLPSETIVHPSQLVKPFGYFKTFADITYPPGEVRFTGSTTWASIETTVLPQIRKAAPQFRFTKVDVPPGQIPGSAFGLKMLKQDRVLFAHVSRVPENSSISLKPYPVAYTFKAISVHPDVDIRGNGLTLNQIKQICKGDIRNWADVGGPDLPITVIDRLPQNIPTQPDSDRLQDSLGDSCAATKPYDLRTTSSAILKVKDTPGSFMITAAPLVVPQCSLKILPVINNSGTTVYPFKTSSNLDEKKCQDFPRQIDVEVFRNGSYLGNELRDTLHVYLNENNPKSLYAASAYINALRSCEGQALIETAGYVRYDFNSICLAAN